MSIQLNNHSLSNRNLVSAGLVAHVPSAGGAATRVRPPAAEVVPDKDQSVIQDALANTPFTLEHVRALAAQQHISPLEAMRRLTDGGLSFAGQPPSAVNALNLPTAAEFPTSGVMLGRGLQTEASYSIGLSHESVSRRHAQIKISNDGYTLCDLGSSNGTYINGHDIRGKGSVALQAFDEVILGSADSAKSFRFVFVPAQRQKAIANNPFLNPTYHPDYAALEGIEKRLTTELAQAKGQKERHALQAGLVKLLEAQLVRFRTELKKAGVWNEKLANYRELTSAQQDIQENIFSATQAGQVTYEGSMQALESARELQLLPKHKIFTVANAKYTLSDIAIAPNGRAYMTALVEVGGKQSLRVFYESRSSGLWRALPGVILTSKGRLLYDKGRDENDMNLPPALQKRISQMRDAGQVKVFTGKDPVVLNFENLVFNVLRHPEEDRTQEQNNFREAPDYLPGQISTAYETNDVFRYFLENANPETMELRDEFSPDFNRSPKYRFTTSTATLGEVQAEIYPSKNGSLDFTFFVDKQGRAYVAAISTTSPKINGLGVASATIPVGRLTTPLYEYTANLQRLGIADLFKNLAPHPQFKLYSDVSAYVRQLPVIRDYLEAKEKKSVTGSKTAPTVNSSTQQPTQPPTVADPHANDRGIIFRPPPEVPVQPEQHAKKSGNNSPDLKEKFNPNYDINKRRGSGLRPNLDPNTVNKRKRQQPRNNPNDPVGNPNYALTPQGKADLDAQKRRDDEFRNQGRVLPRTGRINNKPAPRIVSAPPMNATRTSPVTQAISLLRQAPDKVTLVRQWRQEGSQLLTSLIGTQDGVTQMLRYGLQGAVLQGLSHGGTSLLRTWKTADLLTQVKTPALQANARQTAQAIVRMLRAAPVARTTTVGQARAGYQQLQTQVDDLKRLLDASASTVQIQEALTALEPSIDRLIDALKALAQQTGAGIDRFAKEGARQAMAGLQQLKARVQDPQLAEDLMKLGMAAGTVFLTIALVPLQVVAWVLEKLGGGNSAQGAY